MTTRDEARRLLSSPKAHDRLRAARYFSANATPDDQSFLADALRQEDLSWARDALERALERSKNDRQTSSSSTAEPSLDLSEEAWRDIRNQALAETASLFIHEIEPLVGVLKVAAAEDIQHYNDSETARTLSALDNVLQGISRLRVASRPPEYEILDLPSVLDETLEEFPASVQVQLAGRRPFHVNSDAGLLRIALANGLRNAVEATQAVAKEARDPVITNWDSDGKSYWVSILDSGSGLPGAPNRAFELGTTTKVGHQGVGLAVARQAIESLGGTVSLMSRSPTGVRLVFTVPLHRTELDADSPS